MEKSYNIKISKETEKKISFNIIKDGKFWCTTPTYSKDQIVSHSLDYTLKNKEIIRTIEQILNNSFEFKQCTKCKNISVMNRTECWKCHKNSFRKLTDDLLGHYFKEDSPFREVRV